MVLAGLPGTYHLRVLEEHVAKYTGMSSAYELCVLATNSPAILEFAVPKVLITAPRHHLPAVLVRLFVVQGHAGLEKAWVQGSRSQALDEALVRLQSGPLCKFVNSSPGLFRRRAICGKSR